jgi:hypothetical protein
MFKSIRWSVAAAACLTTVCASAFGASPALIELRQYVTYPGKRDELISLFESRFVESQEELGMMVLGTFREPEHPSHFTWMRGFSDMDARAYELNAFYSGPVWAAHRNAANATIEDSDNVLLLRDAYSGSGLTAPGSPRPPIGSFALPAALVVINIYYLKNDPHAGFIEFFKGKMAPELDRAGIHALAALVPESNPNNYPKLRIREREKLFVWLARFDNRADYEHHLAALERSGRWREHVFPSLDAQLDSPPEVLKLQPTARSLMR